MSEFITILLIVGLGVFIVWNIVDIVKTIKNRKLKKDGNKEDKKDEFSE